MRAWMSVIVVACTVTAACGGSDSEVADSGGDESASAALQEQLDAANAELEAAQAERDEMAEQLAALQAELDARAEQPPVTEAPAATTPAVTETTVPVTQPAPTTVPAGDPGAVDASPWVATVGDVSVIELPAGDGGVVAVVANTQTLNSSGSVPVVVRNNTSSAIGDVEVTGIIRDSDGALVVSGSSQGFKPVVVRPGEIAWGYVYFDYDVELPSGASIELSASGSEPSDFFAPVSITEINAGGDEIIGVITNDSDVGVSLVSVDAVCFDTAGTLLDTVQTFADQDEIAPGGVGSFTLSLYGDPCPVALVSAGGFTD